eukprot:1830791-Pleurochrysis_carterae.AAC.1
MSAADRCEHDRAVPDTAGKRERTSELDLGSQPESLEYIESTDTPTSNSERATTDRVGTSLPDQALENA